MNRCGRRSLNSDGRRQQSEENGMVTVRVCYRFSHKIVDYPMSRVPCEGEFITVDWLNTAAAFPQRVNSVIHVLDPNSPIAALVGVD